MSSPADFEARRRELWAERDFLLAAEDQIEPAVFARALRVLADKFDELAAEMDAARKGRADE